MMQRRVLAANWKMNHSPPAARAFVEAFAERYAPRHDRTVILFPPALSFGAAADAASRRDDIWLGVQNVYWEAKGAFTGETSAPMARDAGARVVLVGHSERRHIFAESDGDTQRKCEAVARAGLIPLLCVGELLTERERGETERVVLRQLAAGFASLDADTIAGAAVAYEPVWAIGTGRTARPADASAVHRAIRAALHDKIGRAADGIPILYGGSVNTGNANELLAADQVDGLLVGGASLDPVAWGAICAT